MLRDEPAMAHSIISLVRATPPPCPPRQGGRVRCRRSIQMQQALDARQLRCLTIIPTGRYVSDMSEDEPTASASAGLTKGAFFRHFAIKEARAIAAAEHPAR